MYGLSEADLVGRDVRIFTTYAFSGDVRRQPWGEPVMAALRGDGHAVDYLPSNWTQQGHLDFQRLSSSDCQGVSRRSLRSVVVDLVDELNRRPANSLGDFFT